MSLGCTPSAWVGFDGQSCGGCAALVEVRDNGGSCAVFCARQGLGCLDGWDDTTDESCSVGAARVGCSHQFTSTSDGICECQGVCRWCSSAAKGRAAGPYKHRSLALCDHSPPPTLPANGRRRRPMSCVVTVGLCAGVQRFKRLHWGISGPRTSTSRAPRRVMVLGAWQLSVVGGKPRVKISKVPWTRAFLI